MKEDSARNFLNYEIKETLQKSYEGSLYRAVDRSSGSTVLIKKYYPSLVWSDQILLEFLQRVEYLRFIEHEGLLPIVGFGKHEGLPYIVYADDSLTLLSAHPGGQPGQEETFQFLHGVAEALDFLHRQEIIHGILNAENIALDPSGNPRLFDFGLSAIFKGVLQGNMDDGFQNLCVSNPACTSPEQLKGLTPTRSSDIYAYGMVGYFYIFGEFPLHQSYAPNISSGFPGHPVIQKVRMPGTIPEAVLHFIEKCIQTEPADRFANISQVLKALDRRKAGKKDRLRFKKRFVIERPSSRSRYVGIYLGAAVLLISLLASLYLFLPHPLSLLPGEFAKPTSTSSSIEKAATAAKTGTDIPFTEPPPSRENTHTEQVQALVGNKPAVENETPILPSQPISFANFSALREISRLGVGRPEELAVSPDNAYIAGATSTGVYIFRDNQLYTWIDPGNWATSLQFSPDGGTLSVGVITGDIQLWDWKTGTQTATLTGHTGKINRILYSNTGWMYSASADGNIIVWDVKTNTNIGPPIDAHSRSVNDIAVTSDGRIIVSCSDDGLIRVWDVASGKKLYQLPFSDQGSKPKAIAMTPDDAYFAVGGESGYVYQWNLIDSPSITNPSPNLRTDPIPVTKRIWSLQYIRGGAELLAGIDGGETQRYNSYRMDYPGVARNFEILPPPKDLVDVFGPGFDFSSSAALFGENIISSNWDGEVLSQETRLNAPMYDILDRLDISEAGTILAAGGRRDTIHIWDLTTNQPLYKDYFILPHGDAISPDGSSIAIIVPKDIKKSVTTGNIITEYFYRMRQLAGNQATRDFSMALPNGQVSYTREGAVFVAGDMEKSTTWDFASGYETESSGHGIHSGCRISISKNDPNEVLQVYSPAGAFTEWKEPNASNLCQLAFRFRGALSAFSDNLELFVYNKSKSELEGHSVASNSVIWKYPHDQEITAVAISADGKIVALGDSSGDLILVDGETGTYGAEIKGNFGAVRAIVFSKDGRLIITSGDDGSVRVFGMTDPK